MNIIKIGIFIIFIGLATSLKSQTLLDVFEVGETQLNSSSVNLGIGGCATAVPQQASSSATNPAALGILDKSHFVFSPGVFSKTSNAIYSGESNSLTDVGLRSNFIGIYMKSGDYHYEVYPEDSIKKTNSINVGFTYFKSKDFNQKTELNYLNANSSITESFAYLSENKLFLNSILNENDLKTVYQMAFMAFLTESDTSTGEINKGIASGNVNQNLSDNKKGGIHNLEFSLGKLQGKKLSLGISGGLCVYSKSTNYNFDEYDQDDNYLYYKSLQLEENTQQTGSGFYYRLGSLYTASKNFSVGFNYTSSSRIRILNDYNANLSVDYINHPIFSSYLFPERTVSYRINRSQSVYVLKTPANYSFALNYGNKKWGFMTTELNYIRYTNASFEVKKASQNIDINALNNSIKNTVSDDINIKLGAEVNLKNQKVRGGIGALNLINTDYRAKYYSIGYGLSKDNVSFNFAFVRNIFQNQTEIYKLEQNSPQLEYKLIGTNIVFGIETQF